jgi:imidazole glycerol phosphate synthase glutamine amidotransferase subunit
MQKGGTYMIAIIDYGVGNLFSLASSLKSLGLETKVTRDAAAIRAADHIILPGVGAFADAMAKLEATGLVPVIKQEVEHKPLLGICLGMQLLFEKSYEYGEHTGLGRRSVPAGRRFERPQPESAAHRLEPAGHCAGAGKRPAVQVHQAR